ncbi:MAG TPA: 2Fe-2S iron-sulfur cluster-binding protein [Pyrinomonadaceae bacterium]|nr:2Fe-2S iron-sulfur cluster-binding protein [Pyrinomonadaceae bacterium]
MPRITAETATGTQPFDCDSGRKLVHCIEDSGIDILHRCGGNARCTTCRIEILHGDPGPIREAEKAVMATKPDMTDHMRLSCQVRVIDDLHIRVINQSSVAGMDPGPRPADEDTP